MAITATFTANANGRQRVGRQKVVDGRLTFGGSDTYATGGFSYTPALFGLSVINSIAVHGAAWAGTGAVVAEVDTANSKIKLAFGGASTSAALAEVANTTALNSYVLDVTVKGR